MDIDQLRNLYQNNAIARVFLDEMAGRARNQSETKIDRILVLLQTGNNEINRSQIVQLFRQLQEVGCGQFVTGRWGWPSRFVWNVGSLAASRVASGEEQEVEPVMEAGDQTGEVDELEHTFNLRPDYQVSLTLPLDLTQSEAERLAGFVRTLPMEE